MAATHIEYFYDGENLISYWFILNAIGMYLLSMSNNSVKWINDITKGYLLGYLIEVIRCHYLEYEQNHMGEIMIVAFPIVGYCWRTYKDKTVTVALVTGLGTALKWLITKILTILFS